MQRVKYGENMQTYNLSKIVKIDKELIKNIADSLAEELAKKCITNCYCLNSYQK
jgi:hypothetical protein